MDKVYVYDYTNGNTENVTMYVSYKLYAMINEISFYTSKFKNYNIVPDAYVKDNVIYLYNTEASRLWTRGTVEE